MGIWNKNNNHQESRLVHLKQAIFFSFKIVILVYWRNVLDIDIH